MTAMLDVQPPFPLDRQEHDPYTYENDDSGRLESAPSPEVPFGMVMSDPTPTHVAHWGSQEQTFTGFVQDYSIVPKYEPPPKKQRTERRRERLNYTRYQLEVLNYVYKFIRYPNNMQKQLIGKRVGISRHQAKIWFQNRRRKDVMNMPPSDTPDDKCMVPDAVKKGILGELLKHKDGTPVKTTFRPEPREQNTGAKSVSHRSTAGRSSPHDVQRMGTTSPDALLSSDSNSYSSQTRSAPAQQILSEDVYSDVHSDPGSPYSPQVDGGSSRRQSTDQGVYSDATHSNPGSPHSQFSISPTSAFKPRQKTNQNGSNKVNGNQDPSRNASSDLHKETFFAYNDGSFYYPGAQQVMSAYPYLHPPPLFQREMPHALQNSGSSSPPGQEKSQSPKAESQPNGATAQGFSYLPGYQELMNYKQSPEVPESQNTNVLEAHSDDLVSHRSHSNSEAGSDHGEVPETGHHVPIPAHQAPAFNINRVFPFPFYAEPPMALSAMPNQHYQYHPWAYQPHAIQTAHNPFYGHCQDLTMQPQPERRQSSEGTDLTQSPSENLKEL